MLCVPFIVEDLKSLKDILHLLGWGHQVGDSEVVSAGRLTKTTSRNGHDSSLVDQIHAVEEIRLFSDLMGLINELLRELYFWEPVHGTLDVGTCYVFHFIEGGRQHPRFSSQRSVQFTVLSQILCHGVN